MRPSLNSARRKAPNKFGARPKTVDGIRFDSTLEARYYEHLKLLKQAGVISELELQVKCEQPLWLIRKSGKKWVKEAIYA